MDINTFAVFFPPKLTERLLLMGTDNLEEIRIMAGKNCIVQKGGKLIDTNVKTDTVTLKKIIEAMCKGSMYAMQTSLVKGYIPLPGGHRVGVCARAVTENGKITHMADISAICIRISRQIIGAADELMQYLETSGKLYNTLIISPPGGGKTTVLRDVARQMGNRYKVCIVDERSEIAAASSQKPFDVGKYTCVMDGAPKAEGIMMLLRTMSPNIIITDETGSQDEERAIYETINCGVKIITTAHGYSERDVAGRKYLGRLTRSGVFERIIVLGKKNGTFAAEKIICDGRVIRHV